MKSKIISASFFVLVVSNSAWAYHLNKETNSSLENFRQQNIDYNGNLSLRNVTITDTLKVNGNINAININLNNIDVDGRLILKGKNSILGSSYINGDLIASNTSFANTINILSYVMYLNNNSEAKDIYIRKYFEKTARAQFVYLDNSTINGNIVFESGLGKVILSNGAKVNGYFFGGIIEEYKQ